MDVTRPEPRLIKVREAARRLGISRSKLYELLAAGELPSVVIGRNRRIDVQDLVAFIDAHRVGRAETETTRDTGART